MQRDVESRFQLRTGDTESRTTNQYPDKMSFRNRVINILSATGLFMAALTSCKNGEQYSESSLELPVITVAPSSMTVNESYSASIQGQQDIEIYPQVSGTISRVLVKEGQHVTKGQSLFVIDQVPYQAALRTAKANVQAAQAQVETARLDYESKKELFKEDVISDYDLQTAKNALTTANAALDQAKAGETDARNSLSYTEVKSPASGVVGTLPYKVGALVGPTITQPLTTVSDNTNMHVYFSMTENQMRSLMSQYGTPAAMIEKMPAIKLQLNDGSIYGETGRIETISGVINPQTGTLSIRSVFPNSDGILWSGGIGNVIIPHDENNAIVIPQTMTYEIQDKIIVYKVIDGKAIATFIKVRPISDGNNYVVTEGLSSGDIIISEGVGLVKEGMEIKIKE